MSYNILNFPEGNIAGREDTLQTIINDIQPDIFLIQELQSDSGLQLIVNRSFSGLPSNYAAGSFLPQQSNSSSNHPLQQALVYNSDLFGLAHQGHLMTSVRDINRFKLFWKPSLPNTDTLFIYVFVTHLKSSQGTSNQAARLEMVQALTTHLQYLPPNSPVIFAGDLNVYSSEEPAYQQLLNESNAIVLRDPINTPGNWHSSSFQPKNVLTQSTRSSSIFGDGAGGGMDDRFDFILLSANMFTSTSTASYQANSYRAVGNSGNCYNQSITNCTGGQASSALRKSLYHMSDHLPIVLKLAINPQYLPVNAPNTFTPNITYNINGNLAITWSKNEPAQVLLYDMSGRVVTHQSRPLSVGKNTMQHPFTNLETGCYIVQVVGAEAAVSTQVFITH